MKSLPPPRILPSKRFPRFCLFLFRWEGGYENDPHDPGGETNFGIDKRDHPTVDIRNLTAAGAGQIYWDEIWQPLGCENLGFPLGEVLADAAVNCGLERAKSWNAATAHRDWESLMDRREQYYRIIAASHPSLRRYLRGWLNRCAALRVYAQTVPTAA